MKKANLTTLAMAVGIGLALWVYLYSARVYYEARQYRIELVDKK